MTTPDGYMRKGNGDLTPIENVKPIDIARNELVLETVTTFGVMQRAMIEMKKRVLGDINAFVEMSAEEYGVSIGGKKGNITLMSYDGSYKLQLAISEYITFDERLQVAKTLIDECIHEWSDGARSEIRALVNDAFQVDKEGKVSTSRILGLRRLNIDHPKWNQAMQAISDSIQTVGSKSYVRVYQRQGEDSWKQITLDFAALEVV